MGYSKNFGSNFPDSLIPVGTKKDVDDSVKTLIAKYYEYIDCGDYTSANVLYTNNQDTLEPYMIDMALINRFEEEIYNIGYYTLNQMTTIVADNEPETQSVDSTWYLEY